MIGMTMGDEHCVKVFQSDPESLLAKIAGSVNDNRLTGVLD
jgi:hypothetical protein